MDKELSYTLRLKDLLSGTIKNAAGEVKKLDGTLSGLSKGLSSLKSTIVGAFAVGAVVNFGKAIIDSLKNYEYFHASLKVLLFGNIGAANALEKQLISLSKTTPFTLVEVQEGSKQLLAYSFAAGEIVDNMKMLGDISSGVGKPLGELVYLYGTLKTQGRAFTKDINQFTTAGINLLPQLAKQFRVADKDVMQLVQDGKVGFKDVETAFKSMTKEGGQFFGMMNEQSKTVGGRLSNLGDAWEQLKVKIGQSQTGIIATTLNWGSTLINSINDGIDALNLLDKAFKNTESSQYSFFEKYITGTLGKMAGMVGMSPTSGGFAEMQQYAGSMKKNLGDTSKDKLSAASNNSSISNIIKNIFADKSMSDIEKNRRVSILQEIRKSNLESMSLFGMKENKGLKDGSGSSEGGASSSTLGSGVSVSGNKPQSITINIEKLIEAFNLNTTNLQEGSTKVKEMVAKALLEAVNDVNLIATA